MPFWQHQGIGGNMLLILIISILYSHCANAQILHDDLPDWLIEKPLDSEKFEYYIGRSEKRKNIKAAIFEAKQLAFDQIIEDHFGVTQESFADTESNLTQEQYTKRRFTSSDLIQLKGFKLMDYYTQTNSDGYYSAYVLYLVDKNEIKKSNIQKTDKSSHLKIAQDKVLMQIEISTLPEGADVFVDGMNIGKTPLISLQNLKSGKYDIKIDHPLYETINFQTHLNQKKQNKIKKLLQPAKTYLTVNTQYPNSKVFLNDKFIGLTPLKNTAAKFTQLNELRIEGKFIETMSLKDLTLRKNTIREFDIKLKLKQHEVSISTDRKNVDVFVSDKFIGVAPVETNLEVGKHNITLKSRDGQWQFKEQIIVSTHGIDYFVPKEEFEPITDIRRKPSATKNYYDTSSDANKQSAITNKEPNQPKLQFITTKVFSDTTDSYFKNSREVFFKGFNLQGTNYGFSFLIGDSEYNEAPSIDGAYSLLNGKHHLLEYYGVFKINSFFNPEQKQDLAIWGIIYEQVYLQYKLNSTSEKYSYTQDGLGVSLKYQVYLNDNLFIHPGFQLMFYQKTADQRELDYFSFEPKGYAESRLQFGFGLGYTF